MVGFPVLSHTIGQRSSVAPILHGNLQLGGCSGLLLYTALVQDTPDAIHQLRSSLQLTFLQRGINGTKAHPL